MLLILEADPRRAHDYREFLDAKVEIVQSVAELEAACADPRWDGFIVSTCDPAGVEAVARRRRRSPVMLVVEPGNEVVRRRASQFLSYVYSAPVDVNVLAEFAADAFRGALGAPPTIYERCRAWKVQYQLTDTEYQVIRLRVSGTGRARIARQLGQATATLDRHAKNIIAKTRDASLDEAVIRLLTSDNEGHHDR